SNYSMAPLNTTGDITAQALTVLNVTANDKPYDGNTTAALNTGTAALSGVVSGEEADVILDVSGATGTFTPDANAGTGKTVTTSGFTISGGASGNYSVTQPTTTASITQIALTVTATGPAKTYGTALATIPSSATNFTASATGVGTETVTAVTLTPDAAGISTATAAGATYLVTPSNATGTGGFLAANYNINYVPFTGTVAQASLTITANNVSKIFGNTLTGGAGSAAFTSNGLKNSETIGSVTITYVPV